MSNEYNNCQADNSIDYPYLAVIPYNVLCDKQLDDRIKIYFGCLAALAKKEGYCYASDKSLAEMKGVSVRTIERWNQKLEKLGYINRVVKNIPYRNSDNRMLWKNSRRIYVNDGFSIKPKQEKDNSKNVCGTTTGGGPNATDTRGGSLNNKTKKYKNSVCIGEGPKALANLKTTPHSSPPLEPLPEKEDSNIKNKLNNEKDKLTLHQIFNYAFNLGKDWNMKEIRDAFKILQQYTGTIHNPIHFIEGTIKNMRMKKKQNYYNKQQKVHTCLQNQETFQEYQESQRIALEKFKNRPAGISMSELLSQNWNMTKEQTS